MAISTELARCQVAMHAATQEGSVVLSTLAGRGGPWGVVSAPGGGVVRA
jgi:hypothetical protein